MKKISSSVRLHNEIQLLEVEQALRGQLMKDQFLLTYESLKPINLIKNTLKEIATSPVIGDNVLGSLMGLATGYLSKKIVVGGSANIFRKLVGSILQFGVANAVAKHPEAIRLIGDYVSRFVRYRKERNSTGRVNR
jgi:hypothetical protein